MPRIVYSRHYNMGLLGLERLHPFDSRKYGRAWRVLRSQLGPALDRMWIRPPSPVTRAELLSVHTPAHLERLRSSQYVARALELPPVAKLPRWAIDWGVLRPMRWATAGTVLAAREALQHGLVVNLGGGFHHAKPDGGEGFSIYSDIVMAARAVRTEKLIPEKSRVAYIDLDAHQGNGVCHGVQDDRQFFIFDMYNCHIYPSYDTAAQERVDLPVRLTGACHDSEYMWELRGRLPRFLDSIGRAQPVALAIYNAGTDIIAGDPVGCMNLSPATVLERDLLVVQTLRERNIPVLMLLSGGYTRQSYRLVAESVTALIETY